MSFKNVIFVFLLSFVFLFFNFKTTEGHQIVVKIHNLRNLKGQIILEFYNQKKQYVDAPMARFKKDKIEAKNDTLTFVLKGFTKGTYVAAILDDENKNNKMDFNYLHLPLEGFGFSNNAQATLLGKPAYEEALFTIPDQKTVKMKVKYW
jgi:uncharacterized protein (DUF2141 family)